MSTTAELFGDELHWLLSTPSRLVGQLETGRLRLQIAFDVPEPGAVGSIELSSVEGPLSRERLLLSADFGDRPALPAFVLPRSPIGDEIHVDAGSLPVWVAALASLWFGKRFDVHG